MTQRNIGIKVELPSQSCNDKKCPFHGDIRLRGRSFVGVIVAMDVHRSATVEWTKRVFVRKYERYRRKKTRVRVHNPSCVNAHVGDKVLIHECRPLSKTKNFVVVQKLDVDIVFRETQESLQEDRSVYEQGVAARKKSAKSEKGEP